MTAFIFTYLATGLLITFLVGVADARVGDKRHLDEVGPYAVLVAFSPLVWVILFVCGLIVLAAFPLGWVVKKLVDRSTKHYTRVEDRAAESSDEVERIHLVRGYDDPRKRPN